MDKHLLTEIEIKDFKCFKDFKADGFKRVNLIGGKNNVGKTAFMEACYINVHSDDISYFLFSLEGVNFSRNNLEYIEQGYSKTDKIINIENNRIEVNSNIKNTKFKIIDNFGKKEYEFTIGKLNKLININELSYSMNWNTSIIYIDNFGLTNLNLKEVFKAVQKKDKEEVLYKYINEFDESIINFKIIGGDKPQCKTINEEYRDINEFGDGLKHYISIICSLYACENGYLFIDEIDNGIHYTQQDRLWKIILTISKEQNVQVFATTHSKECIESFARVSDELEDEDISFISLYKDRENNIKSVTLNNQEIKDRIELGLDNR